ncbi:MAG: HIT family protein [Candidatus ainarchaeum sp.]|nr:HIT family protein [Candidatus ainarchaeum sp.]MDD3976120.1 HIT family protein [Candidatus ainarchaeum sp.]
MIKEDCIFCKIAQKQIPSAIIYEDDNYLAFLDRNPMHPGHTLLIPKEHTDYIFDLNDEKLSELFIISKKVSQILKKATNCEKVGIAVEGFLVRHVHVHLVPLNNGDSLDPCLQKPAEQSELDSVYEKIIKSKEK